MKKMLTIVMALAMVAGVAMNASANCTGCKGEVGLIEIPKAGTEQTVCASKDYDYDGIPTAFAAPWQQGRSLISNNYCDSTLRRKNKLIFKVCDCGSTNIAQYLSSTVNTFGQREYPKVGIQMDILTPGVYWATPNVIPTNAELVNAEIPFDVNGNPISAGSYTKIALGRFQTESAACEAKYYNEYTAQMPYAAGGSPLSVSSEDRTGYFEAVAPNRHWSGDSRDFSDITTTAAMRPEMTSWAPNSQSSFGVVRYYKDAACATNEYRIPQSDNKCTVDVERRAKSLQSALEDGYRIRKQDEDYSVSYWWIDVPPYRVDSSEAQAFDVVTIKVSLLSDNRTGTICASCIPFCTCTIEIARMVHKCAGYASQLIFPYVVQQTAGWNTGIAIANLEGVAALNPAIAISLVDSAGTIFKAQLPMSQVVNAWDLDSMISGTNALTWTSTPAGRTVAPGYAWMCVNGNFTMDGYSFLTDGNFGAGTLPRLPAEQGVPCP